MNVKGSSGVVPPGGVHWLPDVDDPADLFALLYDALSGTATSQRAAAGSVAPGRAGLPARRAGDTLASWYRAPEVKRGADHVYQLACDGSLNRREIAAAVPSDPGAATFAVLLGLDRALHQAHPRERRAAMGGLSPVGVRYVRTGRLNTDRVPGALLPRAAHVDAPGEDHLAACFAAVERIPGPTWSSVLHQRLATHLDPGHPATGGEFRLAVAPLLAHDDLALTVISDWAGELAEFRLSPRDTPHLRERLRRVLATLDASGAVIAAFPDHTLTKSLLGYWQELLRSTPVPLTSSLKWILVGGGAVDPQAPSVSQVFVLDRDLGEVVLAQEKLVRSRLDAQQAALSLLDGGPVQPKPAGPGDPAEAPVRPSPAELTEDIAPGTALRLIDASLGRVAIAAGPQPGRLEPVLRHVTHLLRAELSTQAGLEELRDSPPATGGLVLASSLLLSGMDPAGPVGGGVITVPGDGGPPDGGVMALTFQPDELAVFSVPAGAAAGQLQPLPTDEPPGAAALRHLRRQRATEPRAFLEHGAAEVQELIGALDPAREPRYMAMALSLLAEIHEARGWLISARRTAGRVIGAARSGRAQFMEAEARALQCRLSYWGEQPLSAVAVAAREALAWAEDHGYPRLAITALDVLAQVAAQQRRFDSARGLLYQATEKGARLVAGPYGAELAVGYVTAAALVQLAAGDLDAAADALDSGDSVLRRLGAGPWRAPVLALSARVRHRLGSREAAHDLLELCLSHGADRDVAVQAGVHGVSALLHADEGDELLAEQLARTAVKLGDWSERVDVQAQARMDLASVLLRTGRRQEAALPAAWALRLYERRGDDVSAAAVRELISQQELGVRAPGLQAEAWISDGEPILRAGHSTKIGIRLHAETAGMPGTIPPRRQESEEILVTLAAGGKAVVRPNGRRVNLPAAGFTAPIIFEVIPRDPIPLWLHFLIYLYQDGALLQELGITMPVLPSAAGEEGQ